jgi:hypothetical protein
VFFVCSCTTVCDASLLVGVDGTNLIPKRFCTVKPTPDNLIDLHK